MSLIYELSTATKAGSSHRVTATDVAPDNFRLFHTPLFYRFPFKLRSIPSTPKGETMSTGQAH